MADHHHQNHNVINSNSGFNSVTKSFHTLRPPIDLPPQHQPLSVVSYAFSLRLNSPWLDPVALINSSTGQLVSYSEFSRRVTSLASYLQYQIGLSQGDVAFLLSPNVIDIPIIYFSLLSLGVVVSPANPLSTESEISRLIQLCKPVIAFATSSTSHKIPKLRFRTIIIDSPEFDSATKESTRKLNQVHVSQSDLAAIMFSSGTTGEVKGVMLTHRNFIAIVAEYYYTRGPERESPAVVYYTVPFFHVFGFFYSLKSVALSEAVVVMERFDLKKMFRAVEEFRVTHLAVAPPVLVAMVKGDLTDGGDLGSLENVGCGAAPLKKEVITAFRARFPKVILTQGYGLTEAAGVVTRMVGPEEAVRWGTAGKLSVTHEARIVDPDTSEALLPGKQGELWVRGPSIMKGYVGNPKATSESLAGDGWLRTGDLCYIDEEGFLHVIDRLKELIKYKGYQVSPAELEQVLLTHPQIADATVTAYPDEEAGEVPMAFVVRQPRSNPREAEIMDFVAKQVSPYKKIRRVIFVNSIPKSPAGKILRKELRKILLPISSSRL